MRKEEKRKGGEEGREERGKKKEREGGREGKEQ